MGHQICTHVTVPEDIKCQCNCDVTPSDCISTSQVYSSASCQCICQNVMEKAKCLLNGKTWNDEKCSCSCPKNTWTPCTTGYVFDSHDTCSCLRIQELVVAWAGFGDSCNNFLALVVALFILFTLIASAIIFHIKYHQYRMIKSRLCKQCHDNLFLSKFASTDL